LPIIPLAHAMILTANYQYVVRFGLASRLGRADAMQPYVMIRVRRVPVERFGHCTARYPCGDGICAVRALFQVHSERVIDRAVGGDHHGGGSDAVTAACPDPGLRAPPNLVGMCCRKNLTTMAQNCARKSVQIFQRIELARWGEKQGGS